MAKSFKRIVDRRMKDFGEIDFGNRTIRVNPGRTGRGGILDTVIHEELHREFPDMSERKIVKLAKKRAKKMSMKKIARMFDKFDGRKRISKKHYKE